MKPDIDRTQVFLGGFVFLGCILFGVFFLLSKIYIANGVSYVTMLLFIIACFYTGLKRRSQAKKGGVEIPWYKNPWLLVGILMFASLVMIFISNYVKNFG